MPTPQRQHARLRKVLGGPFGLLWAGQSVSMLGDGVFLVAFTWQLAVAWQQPALLGLLRAVRVTAEVATLGLGGWIIDRLPRRTIILAADTGRGLLLFALAAALHHAPSVPVLAGLLVGYGILTALSRVALAAYLPEIVPPERLQAANALYGIALQASMICGPAAGTALLSLGSATTALRLDGLSFLLAAITILPLPARPPAATGRRSGLAQMLEGSGLPAGSAGSAAPSR